jgi:hypothetical protein
MRIGLGVLYDETADPDRVNWIVKFPALMEGLSTRTMVTSCIRFVSVLENTTAEPYSTVAAEAGTMEIVTVSDVALAFGSRLREYFNDRLVPTRTVSIESSEVLSGTA